MPSHGVRLVLGVEEKLLCFAMVYLLNCICKKRQLRFFFVIPVKTGIQVFLRCVENWIPPCRAHNRLQAVTVTQAIGVPIETPAAPCAGMTAEITQTF